MQESDPDLITRWQNADEQATHTLFNRYYPRMVHLAILSGLARDEAQDCAQEAFLRAFERRKQLRDRKAIRAALASHCGCYRTNACSLRCWYGW